MFTCKVCQVKDEIITELKIKADCPVCVAKQGLIDILLKQLEQKDIQIAEYKREYKRAIDRVLEKNNVGPIREEAVGERNIDFNQVLGMFDEVPVGAGK